MTVPKKAMIFVLTYIMMGITGVIACSQGIFHVVRQSQMEESLKSSAAELRLVAKENRADSAMLICRDDDNTFYQYPIVRNTDDSSRTASDEEYAATLTFYQKSSCTKARKKNMFCACPWFLTQRIPFPPYLTASAQNFPSEPAKPLTALLCSSSA